MVTELSPRAEPGELTREEHPFGDTYVGFAEALIAAGLITADQLPGLPGRNKTMCTFYDGVPVKKGANHNHDERYLSIRRQGKRLVVYRGQSEHVQSARIDALRAQNELEAAAKYQEEKREEASRRTPDEFRESCLIDVGFMKWSLAGCNGLFPFKFSTDARAKMVEALRNLEALIRSSEVLPLHPEKTSAGKGHLRLAWSAS